MANHPALEGNMGLDSVELVMRVERDFDLDIPDPVAMRLATVGAFVTYLHQALEERRQREPGRRPWSEAELLEALRDIIVEDIGVRRDRITPDARFRKDLGID